MHNQYITNPIKVNILNVNINSGKIGINNMLIFIGMVPKNVRSELEKIKMIINTKSKSSEALKTLKKNKFPNVKKFYGSNWIERLGINTLFKNNNKEIMGGEIKDTESPLGLEKDKDIDFDFDSENLFETDVDELLKDINKSTGEEVDDALLEPLVDKSNIPLEERKEMEQEAAGEDTTKDAEEIYEEEKELEAGIDDVFKNRKKAKIKISIEKDTKINWIYDEVKIFPFDKISEFKLKLYSLTKIPPYRQHIWTKHKSQVYSLAYNIIKSGVPIYEPIDNLLNNITSLKESPGGEISNIGSIEGIPINTEWYDIKDKLKIIANDEFTLIEEYYSKYGITHFNLLDLNSLLMSSGKWNTIREIFTTDQYQKELFYYSLILPYYPMITRPVFDIFIKNEQDIQENFPELVPNIKMIQNRYSKEYDITDQYSLLKQNKTEFKNIQNNTRTAITASIISILNMRDSKEPIIHLRNIFDYYELDEYVDYCQVKLLYNGKKVIMRKAFNKNPLANAEQIFQIFHPVYDKIILDSILFRIRMDPKKTTQSMYLNLFQNGNYTISGTWREEMYYDFDDIYKITETRIQPIIKEINELGSRVLYYPDVKLCLMNKKIAKFTEIALGVFWNVSISENQFNIIKNIGDEFDIANILQTSTTADPNILEYYFVKGMYKFDASRIEKIMSVDNYYEYLSVGAIQQKWANIFQKTRLTRIIHRLSDVKIEITGIKENEYDIFMMYINILFYMYTTQCRTLETGCRKKIDKGEKSKMSLSERLKRKTLTDNKQQDPELYNSRKLYKTNFIYSRVCQKPYQPIMLSDAEYQQLDKEQKSRALQYWNFTYKKPQWYLSTNPKYKYIKFITGKHPKGYCIPCGKKTSISNNPKDPKRIIHDACLTKHIWDKETKTITEKSRYIMSYGKPVEINRLSRLPEDSMEPIFYDSYSTTGAIDQECVIGPTIGYYLYGVNQNLFNLSNVGYIYCISNALGYNIMSFFNECKKRIIADPDRFRTLLNGNIYSYFPTGYKEFLSVLSIIENDGTINPSLEQMGNTWNELFQDIASVYFLVNTITFEDRSPLDANEHDIDLILPARMNNINDFVQDTHKNLIILKRDANCTYYPIYKINTEIFYKTRIVDNKLFNNKNEIIQIIIQIAESKFRSVEVEHIDLSIIKRFLSSSQNKESWKIISLFINKNNYCYAVQLKNKKGKMLYIPIKMSFYSLIKGISSIYRPLNPKVDKNDLKLLNSFILIFNHWIAKISEEAGFINYDISKNKPLEQRVQPIIPFISLDKWILLESKTPQVIGFMNKNLLYYINPISIQTALKIKKTNFTILKNSPYDVNMAIQQLYGHNKSAKLGRLNKNKELNQAMYKHYLYKLFLLEFISLFSKQKNNTLRKKIANLIIKTNFNTELDKLGEMLKNIIPDTEDMKKISLFISNYLNEHRDKKKLLENIKLTRFNFDIIELEKFKSMTRKELKKELYKLSQKIITSGIPKYTDFENYLMACSTRRESSGYCAKKKLIMPRKEIDRYIDILAEDILNPIKSKWIFSNILMEKVITYFKFIKRPFESIQITFD